MGFVTVVQSLSHVWLFETPWTTAHKVSLSFTISRSLLKLMSIESVMPSKYLILCCPLLLPSIFPSIRVFSNEPPLCIRWPKYWSFSFSPSNEYSGLISFRINWFDLLVVRINKSQPNTYCRVKPNKPGFPSFLSCGLQCISSRNCWTRITSLWCPEKTNTLAFSLQLSQFSYLS